MATVLNKRGTRAEINASATANGLNQGEIYLITDENRIAIGLSASTYEVYAKSSETGGGGAITTVTLPIQSSVASPATGNVVMYSQESAPDNYSVVVETPNGVERKLQKDLCSGVMAWVPYGYGATAAALFGSSMAATGASGRAYTNTDLLKKSRRVGYNSTATAGATAYIYSTVSNGWEYHIGNLSPNIFRIRFGISDAVTVGGARSFIGLQGNVIAPTNVAPESITNCIGLAQLDGDMTQWYVVWGGSSAQTPIALGATIGAPTDTTILWEFEIYNEKDSTTSIYYKLTNKNTGVSVSGTVTGTSGTQIPSNAIALHARAWRTNNATALSVGLDICSVYGESGVL